MREPVTASWPFPPLSAAISLWQSCRCNAPVHQPQFHRLAGRAGRESSQIGLVQVEVANLHAGNAAKVKMTQIKVPRTHSDFPLMACLLMERSPWTRSGCQRLFEGSANGFVYVFGLFFLEDFAWCRLCFSMSHQFATQPLKDRIVLYLTTKWCVLFGIAAAHSFIS